MTASAVTIATRWLSPTRSVTLALKPSSSTDSTTPGSLLRALSSIAELDGDAVEYNLKAGETMKVEPGHVAMFEETVTFDTAMISGITNMLFGGEGLFLATLTGPGRIWPRLG